MNDSCLGKQVERCPWPSASLIFILVHNPLQWLPHLHLQSTSGWILHDAELISKAKEKQKQHQQIRVQCLGTSFFFRFFLTRLGRNNCALLQVFLRAASSTSREICGALWLHPIFSSVERIIWARFGLWGVTGRRCYGNQAKVVSYIALYRSSASMRACARTHTHTHANTQDQADNHMD